MKAIFPSTRYYKSFQLHIVIIILSTVLYGFFPYWSIVINPSAFMPTSSILCHPLIIFHLTAVLPPPSSLHSPLFLKFLSYPTHHSSSLPSESIALMKNCCIFLSRELMYSTECTSLLCLCLKKWKGNAVITEHILDIFCVMEK